MSEDSELERLKAKRLAEMQKNISTKQVEPTPDAEKEKVNLVRDDVKKDISGEVLGE